MLRVRAINEARLFHEVGQFRPELALEQLDEPTLRQVVEERGVDFATALLYDRFRRSSRHGPFIDALEALPPGPDGGLPRLPWTVLVVPAAGYREMPAYDGDGLLCRSIAQEFGMTARLVPTLSTGPVAANALIVREALAAEPERSVVLVTLSKGSAETRVALAEPGPWQDRLHAWVQVGGVPRGTWLIDRIQQRWWRRLALALLIRLRGLDSRLLEGFSRDAPGIAGPAQAPPGVLAISLIGFVLSSHVSGRIAARHAELGSLGPNDGFTLILDSVLEPGFVYPVWGADHYFRVPTLSQTLYRVFRYLAPR